MVQSEASLKDGGLLVRHVLLAGKKGLQNISPTFVWQFGHSKTYLQSGTTETTVVWVFSCAETTTCPRSILVLIFLLDEYQMLRES